MLVAWREAVKSNHRLRDNVVESLRLTRSKHALRHLRLGIEASKEQGRKALRLMASGELRSIRAALVKNIRLGQGPLVFHIAGPSGVGKSLTARAVARALMESTGDDTPQDEWCGVRYARWVQPRRPCHLSAEQGAREGVGAELLAAVRRARREELAARRLWRQVSAEAPNEAAVRVVRDEQPPCAGRARLSDKRERDGERARASGGGALALTRAAR